MNKSKYYNEVMYIIENYLMSDKATTEEQEYVNEAWRNLRYARSACCFQEQIYTLKEKDVVLTLDQNNNIVDGVFFQVSKIIDNNHCIIKRLGKNDSYLFKTSMIVKVMDYVGES